MVLIPKPSTEARKCKTKGCAYLAIHEHSRCLKHLPRTRFEHWLDMYNHRMELLRTLFGFFAFIMQVIILMLLLL